MLLLAQFVIRAHHITRLDPYIDESYHVTRAAVVWDFDTNPGRFAHGKVLLYFWLGLFEAEPGTALFTARASIALFSLLTGAAVVQIGRLLRGFGTGALALGLYAALPLAFFYESMAMADPFAAVFAALIAWRSLVFARRPTLAQGVLLGVLIALASLAKLTLALIPALPVMAALLYAPRPRGGRPARVLRPYVAPLAVAALIVALAWLPLLLPAYAARGTGEPFVLVNRTNVQTPGQESYAPLGYAREALTLVGDFTSVPLLVGGGAAIACWLLAARAGRGRWRHAAFLLTWLGASVLPVILLATLVSSRYFMPAAAPMVLLLALATTDLLAERGWRRIAGLGAGLALAAWMLAFALPFLRAMWDDPHALPLRGTNYNEYLSGWISSDDAIRALAGRLDHLDPSPARIYGSYTVCDLLYFYSPLPVTCFGPSPESDALASRVRQELAPGDTGYFIAYDTDNVLVEPEDVGAELVGCFERPHTNRAIWLWQIWRAAG